MNTEHADHCKAVKDMMKAGIDCYMSQGTAEALELSGHRMKIVKPKKLVQIDTFKVMPFSTEHDARDPLGFLIQSYNGAKILFLTDSYFCRYRFKGITHFLIECNYSREILERNIDSGVTPAAIRNRIVKSHFEIENVKEFFRVNDLSKCEEIYLIHISGDNGDPDYFRSEVQKITGKPVYTEGI